MVTYALTWYQYLLIESPQVLLILGKEVPWGLVVTDMITWYKHLSIESPHVLQNLRKEAPWGLVVTDTLTWYQHLLIEISQVLLILVKEAPWGLVCSVATSIIRLRAQKFCYFWETNPLRVLWLQTGSLDARIFLLRALKVLLIMGGKVTQGLEVSEMLSRCQTFWELTGFVNFGN